MPEIEVKTLEQVAALQRETANVLFNSSLVEGTNCSEPDPGCIRREEARPLTKKEKDRGWSRRPFSAYDPEKLCNACAAYWFAERAAQTLHDMVCLRARFGGK